MESMARATLATGESYIFRRCRHRPVRVQEYTDQLSYLVRRREPFALATVTRTEGSTLAKAGFRIIISEGGEVLGGTLGGGCPEGPIADVALRAIKDETPRVVRVHLVDADKAVAGTIQNPSEDEIYVETNCGGTLEVFIEPMLPTERLIVVGQGGKDDVEDALVHLAKTLGFEIVVIDPVPVLEAKPDVLLRSSDVDPKSLGLGDRDFVVVLTKGERDVAVLQALSKGHARFVGLLASRQRLRKDLQELERQGVAGEFLKSLHAPIGMDIGARTPEELALAIMAEVVATKYGKDVPHKPLE